MPASVYNVGRTPPRATTSAISSGRGSDSTRIGAVIPASRSSAASSTRATASQVAPAPTAAAATAGAPWP